MVHSGSVGGARDRRVSSHPCSTLTGRMGTAGRGALTPAAGLDPLIRLHGKGPVVHARTRLRQFATAPVAQSGYGL